MFSEIFDKVEKKYGFKARHNLAVNMYNAIPQQFKHVVEDFGQTQKTDPRFWHESRLNAIHSYLTDPSVQKKFHYAKGHISQQELETPEDRPTNVTHVSYLENMGKAMHFLHSLSTKIDPKWLKGPVLHKTEEEFSVSVDDAINIYYSIGEYAEKYSPEFEAAQVLADGYIPSDDEVLDAVKQHEGDLVSIALMAHGLEVNSENKEKLKEMCVLKKTTHFKGFQKLGVENRRETPIVGGQALENKKKLLVAGVERELGQKVPPKVKQSAMKQKFGASSRNPNIAVSYVSATPPQTTAGKDPKTVIATKEHEDFHQTLRMVSRKYGPEVKNDILNKIWDTMPKEGRDALSIFLSSRVGVNVKTPEQAKEEAMAYVFNYLNSPGERQSFHKLHGHKDPRFNLKMKMAFRHIQEVANKIKLRG
jgi:hypothetical protein